MQCPRCFSTNVLPNGLTYYVCMNPACPGLKDGKRVHFQHVVDKSKEFPDNVIFPTRPRETFYRRPYLEIDVA